MRYSDSSDLSKVSLLSFTLLIFSAGIAEVINPHPAKAASIKAVDDVPTLLLAQSTPPANPAVTPQATSSPVSAVQSNREGGDVTLWWLLFLCPVAFFVSVIFFVYRNVCPPLLVITAVCLKTNCLNKNTN